MTEHISIWRWAITEDLDAAMASLIASADADFMRTGMALAVQGEDAPPDLAQTIAQTEAKMRALGLPDDVLETTLAGLREMLDEAQQAEDLHVPEDGQMAAALASSHMFYDEPYAALAHADIDAQIEAALTRYRAAISKAVGAEGQSIGSYLGLTQAQLLEEDTFETLMEAGIEGATWVWTNGDTAHLLSAVQEDKELPIDLELHRVSTATLQAAKARL